VLLCLFQDLSGKYETGYFFPIFGGTGTGREIKIKSEEVAFFGTKCFLKKIPEEILFFKQI
jgi:hypothetical protein